MKRPYFAGNGRAAAAPAPASGTFCADATPGRPRVTPVASSYRDEAAVLAATGAPLPPLASGMRIAGRPPAPSLACHAPTREEVKGGGVPVILGDELSHERRYSVVAGLFQPIAGFLRSSTWPRPFFAITMRAGASIRKTSPCVDATSMRSGENVFSATST